MIKRKIPYIIYSSLSLLFLMFTVYAPHTASEAVASGLEVCSAVIIPSLLPFLFASNAISALGLSGFLAEKCSPLLYSKAGISPHACGPFIMGLLGGYPIGAAVLAESVRSEQLSAEEACSLLPCVNNTGPAFIIGTAGCAVFSSPKYGVLLYVSHILAALCLLFLFPGRTDSGHSAPSFCPAASSEGMISSCVEKSVSAVLRICGFVLLFSLLTAYMEKLGIFPFMISRAALLFYWEPSRIKSLLYGLMELGSGIASMKALDPDPGNLALASFILGFGSLSVHCQTLSAIAGTKIKCARHFFGRILHGLLSALFTYVFAMLLKT